MNVAHEEKTGDKRATAQPSGLMSAGKASASSASSTLTAMGAMGASHFSVEPARCTTGLRDDGKAL